MTNTTRHLKSELEAPIPVSTKDTSKPTLSNDIKDLLSNKAFADEKSSFKERLAEDCKKVEERRLHPIDFSGIIGHDDLKEEIILAIAGKLCEDERSKAYLKSIDDHAVTGILLHGLPGTGKSSILRSIEKSLYNHPDVDYKTIDCSEFQGNVGSNATIINKRFDEARKTSKLCCVVGIDEIDSILRKKKGLLNDAERTNAMQTNMDGMQDSSKIIMLATTNSIDDMEPASISRFTVINLGLPTADERKEFITRHIAPIPTEIPIDVDVIVKYTEGFTGRQFRDIGKNLNRTCAITKKPIEKKVLFKEIEKFMSPASRNRNKMRENYNDSPNALYTVDNSVNRIMPSIIDNKDNVTYNRKPNALYTVDNSVKNKTLSMEDARLSQFEENITKSKETPKSQIGVSP